MRKMHIISNSHLDRERAAGKLLFERYLSHDLCAANPGRSK